MGDTAIRVENLAKMYCISGQQEQYKTLRDVIASSLAAPFRKGLALVAGQSSAPKSAEEIWALKDISFEVEFGEIVGIIGHNGAGKSTLLKILSRITEPSRGYADIFGRVGALLEVGTGFHPELTGRENTYLNGAILGMTRQEIDYKFDSIVDFSGVERFIDTPVKHFSSGMALRLGFAVAVHMEPEILVIDEVLAVGDAEFQRKCLEKMNEIGDSGRTILFVSHNMAAIRNICHKCIILNDGHVTDIGDTDSVIDKYLSDVNEQIQTEIVETKSFLVYSCQVTSLDSSIIKSGDEIDVCVQFAPKVNIGDPGLYVGLLSNEGQRLAGVDFKDFSTIAPIRAGQVVEMGFRIKDFPLLPGHYYIEIHLKDVSCQLVEFVGKTFPFDVVETAIYGGRAMNKWFGYYRLQCEVFSNHVKD